LELFDFSDSFPLFHPLRCVWLQTNRTVENIGARRLHTVIERVMEEISFDAPDKVGQQIQVTEEYVRTRVGDLLLSTDMRKYIL
jgi:ATP-dependent HslUV protease ATP-binding subunit HslU